MFDVALSSAGAHVPFATSSFEDHPPEHMIDGNEETFWVSTGLFPQEFIISFTSMMNITDIKIKSANVRHLLVERSVQAEPVDFEHVSEREFDGADGLLQVNELEPSNTTAQHLRFTILKGGDHFVSVHQINVLGTAVNN